MKDLESILRHYERLAPHFKEFWMYSDFFITSVVKDMLSFLELKPDDVIADIGCGTGIFSVELSKRIILKNRILCVDVSKKMLEHLPKGLICSKFNLDAIEFSKISLRYDKVILKEIVHHISDKTTLLTNLSLNLNSGGIILIVLSQEKVNYPLFEKALNLIFYNNSSQDLIVNLLHKQGFLVKTHRRSYKVIMKKERYFNLIIHRYMSFLSKLTDEEIEDGISQMRQTFRRKSKIYFNETYTYITAKRE